MIRLVLLCALVLLPFVDGSSTYAELPYTRYRSGTHYQGYHGDRYGYGKPMTAEERAAKRQQEQEQQAMLKRESDDMYHGILTELTNTYENMDDAPGVGCWVEKDCTNRYTAPLDTRAGELRAQTFDPVASDVQKRLNALKQNVVKLIQNDVILFRVYALSVLSSKTINALEKGARIPFPSNEDLKKISASDATAEDMEILFFQKAEEADKNRRGTMMQSVKNFIALQNQWINLLDDPTKKQQMVDLLGRVTRIIENRDYESAVIQLLQKELPEDQRTAPVRQSSHRNDLNDWVVFDEKLKMVAKTYNDQLFSKDTWQRKAAEAFKDMYARIYKLDDSGNICRIRKDCMSYFKDNLEDFLSDLPRSHPLKQNQRIGKDSAFLKSVENYANTRDTFDFVGALYERMPDVWKNTFRTKKLPDIDQLSDKDIQALVAHKDETKRLNTSHILIFMAQKAQQMMQKNAYSPISFDQQITQFEKTMNAILNRLNKFSKGNKNAAAAVSSVQDIINITVGNARRQSPKRVILEYLYSQIPYKYRTPLLNDGTFIEGPLAQNASSDSYAPGLLGMNTSPHANTNTRSISQNTLPHDIPPPAWSHGTENTIKPLETQFLGTEKREKKNKSKNPKESFEHTLVTQGNKLLEGFFGKVLKFIS